MRTLRSSLAFAFALAVLGGACSGDTAGDEQSGAPGAVSDDRIVGIWQTNSGWYKEYRSDGTWGIGYPADGPDTDPWVWGTYTFDGSRFTYYTDPASDSCVEVDPASGETSGMVGIYDVTFSDDLSEQLRTVVDDPCSGRASETTPKMLRYQEP